MTTPKVETSLQVVQKNIDTFLALGSSLVEKSKKIEIQKPEDVQIATSVLKECQNAEKEIEEKRVEIVKPLNDFVSQVNTLVKGAVAPVLEAKNTVKQKILSYNEEQERLRKIEEEKRLAEERARLQKLEEERLAREAEERRVREAEEAKLKAEAEKLGAERAKLEAERIEIERQKREVEEEKRRQEERKRLEEEKARKEAEEQKALKENKVKGIVKTWTYEIVNEDKVPRAFCTPDSKKINQAIKAGIRLIEGINIFEQSNIR